MALPQLSEPARTNPLDVVEKIASINDWTFERAGDDEITIVVGGRWSDYQVSFTWMHDIEALHPANGYYEKNAYPVHSLQQAGAAYAELAPWQTIQPEPLTQPTKRARPLSPETADIVGAAEKSS